MYFKLLILYNQHSKTPKTFHLLSKLTRNKPKILKFKDAISRFFDENKKWTKLVNRMWSNGSFYIYDIYVGHQHFFIAPSSQTVRFTGLSGKQQLQLAAVGCYSDVLCCPLCFEHSTAGRFLHLHHRGAGTSKQFWLKNNWNNWFSK